MTQEHVEEKAARLPACSTSEGILHAMALMEEHNVRAVMVRDGGNAITGVFRLEKDGIRFEPVGS